MKLNMATPLESQLSQSFERSYTEEYFNMTPLGNPRRKPPGRLEGLADLRPSRRRSFTHDRTPFLGDLRFPGLATPAEIALSTLQYLPYPLIVLNSSKTLILANDAMGKLLELDAKNAGGDYDEDTLDRLKGQNLSQLGIDLLQDMKPVWVDWDSFLDGLNDENKPSMYDRPHTPLTPDSEACSESTPTAEFLAVDKDLAVGHPHAVQKTSMVHDSAFEVVISLGDVTHTSLADRKYRLPAPKHVFAKM